MGVLQRFERRIEGLVNGAFAKAFRAEVEPVEIAAALQRETDDKAAILDRDRTMVPNRFIVELAPNDYERLAAYEEPLVAELAAMVGEHAAAQGYTTGGAVGVRLEKRDGLDTGVFQVRSEVASTMAPFAPHEPAAASADDGPGAFIFAPLVPAAPEPLRPAPAAHYPPDVTTYAPPPQHRAAPQAYLEMDGTRLAIPTAVTVIGRGSEADVRIDDPGVSRRHAQVQVAGGHARLVDLGSTNGTMVNGQRVRDITLVDGSAFVIGTTTLVFRTGEAHGWSG